MWTGILILTSLCNTKGVLLVFLHWLITIFIIWWMKATIEWFFCNTKLNRAKETSLSLKAVCLVFRIVCSPVLDIANQQPPQIVLQHGSNTDNTSVGFTVPDGLVAREQSCHYWRQSQYERASGIWSEILRFNQRLSTESQVEETDMQKIESLL